MNRIFQYLFIAGLTAVPTVVGIQTYNQSPPILAHAIPLWQQFLPVILLTSGVAMSAFGLLKVPAYLNWPQELRLIFLALLAFLTLIILWLAILLAYYSQTGFVVGTAVAPLNVLILGIIATFILVLGTFYWADQLYMASQPG